MDYKGLGERIREERLRLHLTQAQLAEAVDISDTYMGAISVGNVALHWTRWCGSSTVLV